MSRHLEAGTSEGDAFLSSVHGPPTLPLHPFLVCLSCALISVPGWRGTVAQEGWVGRGEELLEEGQDLGVGLGAKQEPARKDSLLERWARSQPTSQETVFGFLRDTPLTQ